MKVLYVTTVPATMIFFKDHFKMLVDNGVEIELASNFNFKMGREISNFCFQENLVPFSRSSFSLSNLKSIFILDDVIKSKNIDIVHCHTPIAAFITRLVCAKYRKKGLRVFYTAHGFHFFKGAPIFNWIFYGTLEYLASFVTDKLITINREDYQLARRYFGCKDVVYVPGVGVNLASKESFLTKEEKISKRLGLNVSSNDFLILSVGELNENKNHSIVIEALAKIKENNKGDFHVKYLVCGEGEGRKKLESEIKKYGLGQEVKLLGYRNDIMEILSVTDLFVFPSFREGLPVSVMEAMAMGLPVLASRIRGNSDLIDEQGGGLFSPFEAEDLVYKIQGFINMTSKERSQYGEYNKEKVKNFSSDSVLRKMKNIYFN